MIYENITPIEIEKKLMSRFSKEGFLSLGNLPHPSNFKDMDRATKRIVQAINNEEKIVLIGDYDVDGVISTTIMLLFFAEIDVQLDWVIPNRFKDGYGLSTGIVENIKDYDLAITVDNGISAINSALLCKEYGIELIITDHHTPSDKLPEAYAIINPKLEDCPFPYKEICGGQIAWYLIASLKRALNLKVDIKSYIGLVSIAIIADIMPLQHINRAMVTAGLKLLGMSELPSIKAFKEHLKKESFDSEDIAFQVAPILNSAGRMEDAKYSVQFLMSTNIYDAKTYLKKLLDFNENRKIIENNITEEVVERVDLEEKIIVAVGENWHEGVVGIVASRVGRIFEKPTIILTKGKNGELKGSGRSFYKCNLFKVTERSKKFLTKFGGHHSAIGLSLPIKNLESFRKTLQENYMLEKCSGDLMNEEILGELSFKYIDFELIRMIKQFEPFGHGNSKPKFITSNVVLKDVSLIGKDSEHRRFVFSHYGNVQKGVLFKTREKFRVGNSVDIIYQINENFFNGITSIQLIIDKIIQ